MIAAGTYMHTDDWRQYAYDGCFWMPSKPTRARRPGIYGKRVYTSRDSTYKTATKLMDTPIPGTSYK